MENTFYRVLASALQTRAHCQEQANPVMPNSAYFAKLAEEWKGYISYLMRNHAPSGSGFDHGTQLDASSKDTSLRFLVSFHHMNEGGFYDGWTSHGVIVTPAFDGIRIAVKGRDRNQIKDFIADTFHLLAAQVVPTFAEWRNAELAKRIGREVAKSSRAS